MMKIRRDAVFISGVLFTISLAALIPHNVWFASTWHQRFLPEGHGWTRNYLMPQGFAALTIVFVGLTVIWSGYIKGVRWTWIVMLGIVSLFVFPVYVLPTVLDIATAGSIDWSAWFWNAIKGPGLPREYAKGPLDFLLMLIALLLPMKSFLTKGREQS